MPNTNLIILLGVSGSGKSTALKAFDDCGYECVDNIPIDLLDGFSTFLLDTQNKSKNFALLLDLKVKERDQKIIDFIDNLKSKEINTEVLFFDSQDEVLIRRYRETRRPHPAIEYNKEINTISEAIYKERKVYYNLKEIADSIIDTSSFSPHDLRKHVEDYLGSNKNLRIFIKSFGFKYGILQDADLIMDVRFLPNPYFIEELSKLNGTNKDVSQYVLESEDAKEFIDKFKDIIEFLIPKYKKEGKRYLTIGIACTGGKHRSVAISEKLKSILDIKEVDILVQHRDIKK